MGARLDGWINVRTFCFSVEHWYAAFIIVECKKTCLHVNTGEHHYNANYMYYNVKSDIMLYCYGFQNIFFYLFQYKCTIITPYHL